MFMNTFKLPQRIGFNDIHRPIRWLHMGIWHSGLQENMHMHWWYVTSHCSDPVQVKGRSCLTISAISTLTSNCLTPRWSWISLTVLAEGVFHEHFSHQIRSKRSTCKHGICWTYTHMYCWGTNSGLNLKLFSTFLMNDCTFLDKGSC